MVLCLNFKVKLNAIQIYFCIDHKSITIYYHILNLFEGDNYWYSLKDPKAYFDIHC